MRFLFPKTLPDNPRILLIQTGNPNLTDVILDGLSERYGENAITFFSQRNMSGYLKPRDGIERIENPASNRWNLIAELRRRRFDLIGIVDSGERGFWKLKLLPFVLDPGQFIVFDRSATATAFSFGQMRSLLPGKQETAARRILAPFIGIYLAAWWLRRRYTPTPGAMKIR
jgi:hypothetical protein